MAYEVVVETEETEEENYSNSREQKLVSWIIEKVQPWADHRDSNYKDKWDEFYRIWRGIWTEEDKTNKSERSRLISPATAQAVEVATAEMEEATFGKGRWFDIKDDIRDDQKADAEAIRNLLHEDLKRWGIPQAVAEVFLNSCVYGTGIGKIVVEEEETKEVSADYTIGVPQMSSNMSSEITVRLVPIQPDQFVIDPAATSIGESLGVAH